MAKTKKKASTDWIDDQVNELNEAFAGLTFDEKTKKVKWPKITVGSHSVRTEYEDGRVELVTDWEALKRDVREAIAQYEANIPATSAVEEKPAKKKSVAKITAKKKTKK
jgi:hypothetical protein